MSNFCLTTRTIRQIRVCEFVNDSIHDIPVSEIMIKQIKRCYMAEILPIRRRTLNKQTQI